MEIVDNVLSSHDLQNIKMNVFHEEMPWYYTNTTQDFYKNDASLFRYHFAHTVYKDGEPRSPLYEMLYNALIDGTNKAGLTLNKILRIRIALTLCTKEEYFNHPHVDTPEDHAVGILYLNNTSAKTLLYNEMYDPVSGLGIDEYKTNILNNKFTEYKRIESVENRMIFFKGYRFHSSPRPTDIDRRIIVNFNFT